MISTTSGISAAISTLPSGMTLVPAILVYLALCQAVMPFSAIVPRKAEKLNRADDQRRTHDG
jgi:hypothetical protein